MLKEVKQKDDSFLDSLFLWKLSSLYIERLFTNNNVKVLLILSRLPLFEERLEKIQTVYDYFMQDDSLRNFLPTLSVRKGRKLLARLMPLLDKVNILS